VRAEEILTAFLEAERAIHQFAVSLLSSHFHHSLKSPLCLWKHSAALDPKTPNLWRNTYCRY